MDYVLIDDRALRMLGRGSLTELRTARERLTGDERIVHCLTARGFSVYERAQLAKLLCNETGEQTYARVDYSVLCQAAKAISENVGHIALYFSTKGANEMTQASEQNGVKWPQRGASARVFEIAQQMSTTKGDFETKENVVAACVAEGINAGTAGTQYSAWRRYWEGPSATAPAVAPVAPVAPQAPVAPTPPAHPTQLPQSVVQQIADQAYHAQVAKGTPPPAPVAFQPPAAPQFSAPPIQTQPQQLAAAVQSGAGPFGGAAASTAFVQPEAAKEVAIGENAMREASQAVSVGVGFNVSVDLSPAIAKLEQLLQTLKDAQADFGG